MTTENPSLRGAKSKYLLLSLGRFLAAFFSSASHRASLVDVIVKITIFQQFFYNKCSVFVI